MTIKENKERYNKNKEKIIAKVKEWVKRNKEKSRFIKQHYKYRKKSAEGSFTFEEWNEFKKKNGNICLCCGKKEPEVRLEADHIVPLSKNGTNYINNIQPLCRSCNASKGSKINSSF